MKVLVTGATAPLGEAVVRGLVAARDVELVLAIGREPSHDALARLDPARLVYRGAFRRPVALRGG